MPDMVRALQSDILDLEQIIAADEAVLELEKSADKQNVLREEIRNAHRNIERLKCRIDDLSGVD
jgi:hypothetical protein